MKKTISVQPLALDIDLFGTKNTIYPVLIWDDNEATLVDTGYPGQFTQLIKAATTVGVSLNQIRRIIITHQDWDHIGTMADIISARNGQMDLIAHIEEKPYIEGTLPYIKMSPQRIAARIKMLPAEVRDKAAEMFSKIPTAHVTQTLSGGEELPFHGGIDVIHTPGHTPGHICLYIKSHRLLIAGDQLRVENGILVGPAEIHTPDMTTALKSLAMWRTYDIDYVLCYHGGLYGPNASSAIADLLSRL